MRMMLAVSGSVMLAALGIAVAEDIKSGLQVGDSASPFNVRNITGQNSAVDYAKDSRESLCYR